MTKKDISIYVSYNGMLVLSAMVNDYYITKKYMGYTKKEAIQMFINSVNNGDY